MLRKAVSFILICLTFFTVTARANPNEQKEKRLAEKVKVNIAKLGVGKDSKVKVKLKDGTKLKGFVSEITDSYFVVTNDKTGESTSVTYSQTKQVKGNNLSSGVKIAIGVIAVILLLALPIALSDDY